MAETCTSISTRNGQKATSVDWTCPPHGPSLWAFRIVATVVLAFISLADVSAQSDFYSQSAALPPGTVIGVDLMDTRNFTLLEYRRLLMRGKTPTVEQLQGRWRGVNKGIVTLVGYGQFIKEVGTGGDLYFGDNVKVHQVSQECLRAFGWQPKFDAAGNVEREGRYMIKPASGRGIFGHASTLSYRDGGNRRNDPVRLLVDKVVVIDDNHLLGRVTANFGLAQIPLAYFMLERIH